MSGELGLTDVISLFDNISLIKVINGVISERRSEQTRTAVNLGIAAQGVPVMPCGNMLLLHGGCLCMVGFADANLSIPGRTQGDPEYSRGIPTAAFLTLAAGRCRCGC